VDLPECSKTISAEDTVVFARDRIAHFYCRQPQALSPEERACASLHLLDASRGNSTP
jgi:hypothetical protein